MSFLSSPRLDTSERPRIVLEIAAFSRYSLDLRSGMPRVYPPEAHPIFDDLADRRGSSKDEAKSRPSASCQWQTMWAAASRASEFSDTSRIVTPFFPISLL